MAKLRVQRVSEELKREISDILRNNLKDPRISGIISVTDVSLSNDLSQAKIYLSIYGSDAEQEKTLKAIAGAAGFIRSEVGARVKLRHTPELSFHLDYSLAYGAHINRVLSEIKKTERDLNGE